MLYRFFLLITQVLSLKCFWQCQEIWAVSDLINFIVFSLSIKRGKKFFCTHLITSLLLSWFWGQGANFIKIWSSFYEANKRWILFKSKCNWHTLCNFGTHSTIKDQVVCVEKKDSTSTECRQMCRKMCQQCRHMCRKCF